MDVLLPSFWRRVARVVGNCVVIARRAVATINSRRRAAYSFRFGNKQAEPVVAEAKPAIAKKQLPFLGSPYRRNKRILLVANCQTSGLKDCLNLLRSDFEFQPHDDHTIRTLLATGEETPRSLHETFDYLFLQAGTPRVLFSEFSQSNKIIPFPRIYFDAFHPDLTYAHVNERVLHGLMHEYHSSIILYGYKNGLSVDQTVSLFNRQVFESMGFFNYWRHAKLVLYDDCRDTSFPIEEYFYKWCRRGCFMYSTNHPKIFVLADVARHLLSKIDAHVAHDIELSVPDELQQLPIFPVYPEIGEFYGIRGSYVFKPWHRTAYCVDLHGYVQSSYEDYRLLGNQQIQCGRIDTDTFRDAMEPHIRRAMRA